MSSRQLRRLQELVDRATGLDADASDDDDAVPDTMQLKKPDHYRQHKKKLKKEKKKETVDAPAHITATSAASPLPKTELFPGDALTGGSEPRTSPKGEREAVETMSLVSAPSPPAVGTASDDWEEVSEGDDHTGSSSATKRNGRKASTEEDASASAGDAASAALEDEKRRRKAEKKRLRREKQRQQQRERQAEEEALLDAVLARREVEKVDPASRGVVGSPVVEHCPTGTSMLAGASSMMSARRAGGGAAALGVGGEVSFLSLVMACDANQLDTRLERIRMFGADAVEDVGDGRTPHRRADGRVRDTGSVSFFPAHHLTIRFVHSAFATPNRYRWIPYDSLGIFLTTEEVHDEGGEMCRVYLLACSSNAFQRAQASLEACQERLGGVQDLIDCLARNRVYHIPTILRCVYAMEATGESAFAAELLDVALYQVGVVLRRFALSGTWETRQLPRHRSANTLIFQVMQRGVHSALKRGCLRTAYERTRCLLSLDPLDPCGMLLLLDYTALRAKRWVWLLEMRHRAFAVCTTYKKVQPSATTASSEAGVREALRAAGMTLGDVTLAEDVLRLPNYAFSWALAKHFIEREEERQRSDEASGAAVRPSKVLRGLTGAQRGYLEVTPPAVELLSAAMLHFPQAAVRLVDALGGIDVVCGGEAKTVFSTSQASVWLELQFQAESGLSSAEEAGLSRRLAELFVARHEELWKLGECVGLLRRVLQRMLSEPATCIGTFCGGGGTQESAEGMWPSTHGVHSRYRDVTRDSVMGASVAPIPADLLEPEPAELALGPVFGDDDDAHRAAVQRLVEMLQSSLDTFGENEYLRNLLDQVRRNFDDVTGVDAHDESGHDEADGETPEIYDAEGSNDMEAQEWYSVASEGGEHTDNDDDDDCTEFP